MPIDASIPLKGAKVLSLSDIMRDVEAVKTSRQQRELRTLQMDEMRAKSKRADEGRSALSDLLISQRNLAPGYKPSVQEGIDLAAASPAFDRSRPDVPPPGMEGGGRANGLADLVPKPATPSMPATPPPPSPWERYVRSDPEHALETRKALHGLTRDQFKMTQDMNDASLQILGGVNDQASYEAAKRSAEALYGQYGMSLEDMELPDEYSPGLINALRFRAMGTQRQLEQVRADRKLDWDIEDDEADNERLDERDDAMARDRAARIAATRRGQDIRSGDTRRGQDLRPAASSRGSGYQGPVKVKSRAEAEALPSGTKFRDPNGIVRTRP